ncbi:hypothetical protein BGX28_008069 [Mortierella sp. GBA30]|nr:hypothetical protein BGX28_008069 [Mortierella sp. GBA30]
MTEQTSNAGNSGNPPTHKPNFVEKIIDKIKHRGHDDHLKHTSIDDSQKKRHSFGGPENAHDNAYVAEASVVGAHAIPPMTFHADPNPRHDHAPSNAQPQAQAATQAQQTAKKEQAHASTTAHGQSPSEPFHDFGDRMVGHDLHSAENEHQLPRM